LRQRGEALARLKDIAAHLGRQVEDWQKSQQAFELATADLVRESARLVQAESAAQASEGQIERLRDRHRDLPPSVDLAEAVESAATAELRRSE
jgi:hypothetical protein